MMYFHTMFPDCEALLALEPEELAGYVIEFLNSVPDNEGLLNRYNFSLFHNVEGYPRENQPEMQKALMEAWMWLEREGMLAPRPGDTGDWVFITRRGKKMKGHADLEAYRNSTLLPRALLHPIIAHKVWAQFLRGDYDTAVFQAFKEVEVTVRDAGDFDATDIGRNLMLKAFHPHKNGPLADKTTPTAEQQAIAELFMGAIGYCKNPSSHRHVNIGAEEATEMMILASLLLRIVEARAGKS